MWYNNGIRSKPYYSVLHSKNDGFLYSVLINSEISVFLFSIPSIERSNSPSMLFPSVSAVEIPGAMIALKAAKRHKRNERALLQHLTKCICFMPFLIPAGCFGRFVDSATEQ